MSEWQRARAHRGAGAALAAGVLAVALTACGSGGGDGKGAEAPVAASSSAPSSPTGGGGPTVPDTGTTLATVNGSDGFQFTVNTAKREDGGFLTVTGSIRNTTNQTKIAPVQWQGDETQVKARGSSLAAMTLVDPKGKKRYYVLRDTDGNPLTTTHLPTFAAGQSVSFFAQFPAPPASTTRVDLEFPGLDPATIAIS